MIASLSLLYEASNEPNSCGHDRSYWSDGIHVCCSDPLMFRALLRYSVYNPILYRLYPYILHSSFHFLFHYPYMNPILPLTVVSVFFSIVSLEPR